MVLQFKTCLIPRSRSRTEIAGRVSDPPMRSLSEIYGARRFSVSTPDINILLKVTES